MVTPMTQGSMSVMEGCSLGKEAPDQTVEVIFRSRRRFHNPDSRCRVLHEDVQQAAAADTAAIRHDLVGDISDKLAGRIHANLGTPQLAREHGH